MLCEQIKGMDATQFEITVALPSGSALIQKLNHLPCKIIQFRYGADHSFSMNAIIEHIKIIKMVRPSIVHSHGSLSSRIAATCLNIPCRIFTRHCSPPIPEFAKNPFIKKLTGITNDILSTSIIASAECAKQNLIGMGCNAKKIKTVINGVMPISLLNGSQRVFLRAKYGLNDKDFVVSIFARLEKIKGHRTLLEAAKICKDGYPDLKFFIVGAGRIEKDLKRYAKVLDIEDIVYFTGFCDDVEDIFNVTDLNVNCSYLSETASLSLSEGMSIGIPSVVSDVGGNPYMVKNEENGLVFPAKDPRALASAIIRMYEDDDLYKKCSIGALKRYNEEFNGKIMCKKITDLYIEEYKKHPYN